MPQSLIATSHTGNTMQIPSYSDFSIIPMFNAQPVYALGYSARYSTVFAHGSSSLLSKKPPRIAPEHLSHGGPFAVSPRTASGETSAQGLIHFVRVCRHQWEPNSVLALGFKRLWQQSSYAFPEMEVLGQQLLVHWTPQRNRNQQLME